MAGENRIQVVNGKVVCKVYLLDNSMKTLLVDSTSTVQDVCLAVAEKLGFSDPVDDSLCFSLHECTDSITIERSLKGDREVVSVMEGWTSPESKFVFQCKLFTETLMNTNDNKVIYMLFIQAVYNIITGTYPCNEDDAIQLAALQFQSKFGQHNPATHKPGFLTNTIVEYVPYPHLAAETHSVEEWERLIFQRHAISMTEKPMEAYLSLLSKRDYYGSVLFAARQKFDRSLPKKIFLGISRQGILLLRIPKSFTDSTSMETLASFPLADIFRWAYKPNVNFYFEIKDDDGDDNAIYTFDTAEGQHMSDLLTDYALALLREMGLNADGTRREKKSEQTERGLGSIAQQEESYDHVSGDVGALATAATRSGEGKFQAPGTEEPQEYAYVNEDATATDETPVNTPAEENGLPPNWTQEFDPGSGNYYYFNNVTGESQWEPPLQ